MRAKNAFTTGETTAASASGVSTARGSFSRFLLLLAVTITAFWSSLAGAGCVAGFGFRVES